MSETARLEARMTLDSVQYQRAAAQVEKQAEMMRRNIESVQSETANFGKTLSEAAAELGLFYDANGNLVNGIGQLVNESSEAAQQIRRFEQQMAAAQIRTEKWQKRIEQTGAVLKTKLSAGAAAAKSAVSAIGSGLKTAFIGGTAAAAGFFAYVVKEAGDAREIMQNAVRLNMDTTSLQAWDYAVTKFGISADKAGDILKDVNDKIGDFIVTGGGEAKDVFDALSLSAEEFIGLAPDQALLKMGKAMEGLSTQDKTFLLESLADDASLLIPLLDQNGKKLKELRQQAVGRGMIISPQELQSLADFKESIGEIGNRLTAFGQHFAAYMSKPLKVLLDEADKLIERFGGMDKVALSFSETAVNGMVDIVKWVADVYEWFLKWELKLIDLKAFLFGMADGLANVGEMYLKYTPTGMIQDKAAKAITGTSLTDGLAETRKNFDGILRDLADERAKAEQNIAKAHASAEKFANTVGKKMLDAITQAKKDAEHNIANNYRAPRQTEDFSRSLNEYKQRQAEEAAKEAAKEQDKAAKEQQKAAEALKKAADQAERAWQQSTRGRTEKTAREADDAAPKVPQVQIFSGAPRAAEVAEGKAKKAAEAYAEAVKKAAEAQEKLNRVQAQNQPQAASPQAGIPQQAVIPTPPPVREIKLSGGITVTLNGSDESVAKSVVNSKSFKDGFEALFKSTFTAYLREAARAVT